MNNPPILDGTELIGTYENRKSEFDAYLEKYDD